jgi:hypothetical protein
VAAIASVATSQPTAEAHTELKGTSFAVTTGAPRATRRFVVRATAEDRPDNRVSLDVQGRLSARWQPANPASTAMPWLRTRMTLGSNEMTSNREFFHIIQGEALRQDVWVSASECELKAGCVLDGTLEVELGFDGTPIEGTVAVDWEALVLAILHDASELPEGFTLTISEP